MNNNLWQWFTFLKNCKVDNKTSKYNYDLINAKTRSLGILLGVTVIQLSYFLLLFKTQGKLISYTVLLFLLWFFLILCIPKSFKRQKNESLAISLKSLSILVIALALFKLITRGQLYFTSIEGGMLLARQLLDVNSYKLVSIHSLVNVFLTPLWINLIVLIGFGSSRIKNWQYFSVAAVPLISFFDMLMFGGRVNFAFEVLILFLVGMVRTRGLFFLSILFLVFFSYIQLSRSQEMSQLGFSYLQLTASGETLTNFKDIDSLRLPIWTTGPLVFAQYISHSINEFINLIENMQWWNPTFATFKDQIAALGIGSRAYSQDFLMASNPRFGVYQTFLGAFLIDFGLAGVPIAFMFLLSLIGLIRILKGHAQMVLTILVITNLTLASVENFFIVGQGFSKFILTIFIALAISCRSKERLY